MDDAHSLASRGVSKAPTGIPGLDEITGGGFPEGRPTLVCGGAGCGKTLLAMEFLVHGAVEYGEPGLFVSFEESPRELTANVASLGIDLAGLVERKLLAVDHVALAPGEITLAGAFDLEALFIRLGHAVDKLGARRVVLDTVEVLFAGLPEPTVVRSELRRLFLWLKDRGLTTVITGEQGERTLTRFGIEEYVSDCVVVLDHRVTNQTSTRRIRVVKYRGSVHGTNEFPFLIDERGISVMPISSIGLRHEASEERVSTGIPRLDAMLGGKGVYRGSSVLVSGTAGSGKTTVAAHALDAACRRGERCLSFLFEESPSQVARNMRSVGLDLRVWEDQGLLRFHAARPSLFGLELHLATMLRVIEDVGPSLVVFDPISSFLAAGTRAR